MAHSSPSYPGPAEVTLRPMESSDDAFVYDVYAQTRTDELAQVSWSDEEKKRFLCMQFAAQRRCYENDYPGAEFYIVLARGAQAGRFYLHRQSKEIRIMELSLLPEFRGQGIGTLLIQDVLAEGLATGRPVTIHVEIFNRARALYARLGFEEVANKGVYLLLEKRGAVNHREAPRLPTTRELSS